MVMKLSDLYGIPPLKIIYETNEEASITTFSSTNTTYRPFVTGFKNIMWLESLQHSI